MFKTRIIIESGEEPDLTVLPKSYKVRIQSMREYEELTDSKGNKHPVLMKKEPEPEIVFEE